MTRSGFRRRWGLSPPSWCIVCNGQDSLWKWPNWCPGTLGNRSQVPGTWTVLRSRSHATSKYAELHAAGVALILCRWQGKKIHRVVVATDSEYRIRLCRGYPSMFELAEWSADCKKHREPEFVARCWSKSRTMKNKGLKSKSVGRKTRMWYRNEGIHRTWSKAYWNDIDRIPTRFSDMVKFWQE